MFTSLLFTLFTACIAAYPTITPRAAIATAEACPTVTSTVTPSDHACVSGSTIFCPVYQCLPITPVTTYTTSYLPCSPTTAPRTGTPIPSSCVGHLQTTTTEACAPTCQSGCLTPTVTSTRLIGGGCPVKPPT